MRKPPPSVLAVGALFLALGALDAYRGLVPLFRRAGPVRLAGDDALVLAIGIAALLGATFLLRGRNWARWLLAAWMGLHVALSIAHPAELLAHVVIFALVLFFLFRPSAAAYFRRPVADDSGRVPPFGTAPLPENAVKSEVVERGDQNDAVGRVPRHSSAPARRARRPSPGRRRYRGTRRRAVPAAVVCRRRSA